MVLLIYMSMAERHPIPMLGIMVQQHKIFTTSQQVLTLLSSPIAMVVRINTPHKLPNRVVCLP